MNDRPDINRVLTHWLDDGPTVMPDRLVDVIADRISRQRQRSSWRLQRRLPMNRNFKVVAVLAAGLAIAVAGWNLLPRGSNVGPPSATPSPSPAAQELPDGLLSAGSYIARGLPGDPMGFGVTVPEGWTGFGGFFIAGPGTSGAPDGVAVSFTENARVSAAPCPEGSAGPSPGASGPSVDDVVGALSARSDLVVSGVTDTTLGGYSGKRLDVQLPDVLSCSNYYVFAEPRGLYANGPGNRWRVWLLDVAGDTGIVVLLDYAATPAGARATAQGIVDSLRIQP
jgi:hypothetical protein